MSKGKKQRTRGKIQLSSYFKKLLIGERVAVVKEPSVRSSFPKRIVGKSGSIVEERGNFKVVELNDGQKTKKYILHPIHLKKLTKEEK